MTPNPGSKNRLREQARIRIASLPAADRLSASRSLVARILADPAWIHARTVLLYRALADEPDLSELWPNRGPRSLLLPRIEGHLLIPHAVDNPSALRPGPLGTREPDPARHPPVDPVDIDLILVPGLAFDSNGRRLGRGGGFYDRFLAHLGLRATILGVCFATQRVRTLPSEPHDRPVHRVLSA